MRHLTASTLQNDQLVDQQILRTLCCDLYAGLAARPAFSLADAEGDPQSGAVLECCAGETEALLFVGLDRGADDAAAALRFDVELRRAGDLNHIVGVEGPVRFELIRAFLLGVRAPLLVRKADGGGQHGLSIRLPAVFALDCAEIDAGGAQAAICDAVARTAYDRTRALFADAPAGLAVWRLRAAWDLFDAPRPSVDLFWPGAAPPSARAAIEPVVAGEVAATSRRMNGQGRAARYGVAASLLIALAGLAAYSPQPGATVPHAREIAQTPVYPSYALAIGAERVAEPAPATPAAPQPAPVAVPQSAAVAVPLAVAAAASTAVAATAEPRPAPRAAKSPSRRMAGKAAKSKGEQGLSAAARRAAASVAGVMNDIGRFPNRLAYMLKNRMQ